MAEISRTAGVSGHQRFNEKNDTPFTPCGPFPLPDAVDIKVAGSLSLAVSLPTMPVAFARYNRDQSFTVLSANKTFLIAMALGSVAGTLVGGLLSNVVPSAVLIPLLAEPAPPGQWSEDPREPTRSDPFGAGGESRRVYLLGGVPISLYTSQCSRSLSRT